MDDIAIHRSEQKLRCHGVALFLHVYWSVHYYRRTFDADDLITSLVIPSYVVRGRNNLGANVLAHSCMPFGPALEELYTQPYSVGRE